MEDTLRELGSDLNSFLEGLNPCFNGRYSQRITLQLDRIKLS